MDRDRASVPACRRDLWRREAPLAACRSRHLRPSRQSWSAAFTAAASSLRSNGFCKNIKSSFSARCWRKASSAEPEKKKNPCGGGGGGGGDPARTTAPP